MERQNPPPEPESETPEKPSIRKTQEEFIGDMAQPSISKEEYEKQERHKNRKKADPSDSIRPDSPNFSPD